MELWLCKGLQTLSTVCHVCRSSRSADFPELLIRCSYCYKVCLLVLFLPALPCVQREHAVSDAAIATFKVYCKNCMVKRHKVDFDALAEEARNGQEWMCYYCKGACLCSICAPGTWSAPRTYCPSTTDPFILVFDCSGPRPS
jgi:hypothetical protein